MYEYKFLARKRCLEGLHLCCTTGRGMALQHGNRLILRDRRIRYEGSSSIEVAGSSCGGFSPHSTPLWIRLSSSCIRPNVRSGVYPTLCVIFREPVGRTRGPRMKVLNRTVSQATPSSRCAVRQVAEHLFSTHLLHVRTGVEAQERRGSALFPLASVRGLGRIHAPPSRGHLQRDELNFKTSMVKEDPVGALHHWNGCSGTPLPACHLKAHFPDSPSPRCRPSGTGSDLRPTNCVTCYTRSQQAKAHATPQPPTLLHQGQLLPTVTTTGSSSSFPHIFLPKPHYHA